jgi:8-oxo-dGTP pyrophosphatase MutT (NUDIX family)
MSLTATELDRLAAHPPVARLLHSLAERPGRAATAGSEVRRAAILLAVRMGSGGEPEVLMIKRADAERDPWSGHVALPGGRMEPGDADLAATAMRETWEETGVDVAHDGRLVGALDDVTPRSPTLTPLVIRPFVALVRADVEIVPSHEVAAAFWVPLSALRATESWGIGNVPVRDGERRVSVFRHGPYTVWGLTERVLRQFLVYLGEPPAGESMD